MSSSICRCWRDSRLLRVHPLTFDSEDCTIDPVEIMMTRPGGKPLEPETQSSQNQASAEEAVSPTSRMVDWCVGLLLDEETKDLVAKAFATLPDNIQSLNQSMNFIRHTSILFDIEIKRTMVIRDPRVQLAIWIAAQYKKKLYHQWDTSMPMPGLVVNGFDWECFLFFPRNSQLVRY